MSAEKRAVIKFTDDQHQRIKDAADRLGLSVPAYCKLAALEKSDAKH